ncbi:MAG: oxidoreductase [Verrucomicrobiia bacterium]
MDRLKIATIWLTGCSGCHMSFLDLDEWLFELTSLADIVYTPLMDIKTFPEAVDVTLVEGAVGNRDNLHLIKLVREKSKKVIAFGDCAVTGNVSAMRNLICCPKRALETAYLELTDKQNAKIPECDEALPPLLNTVVPIHQIIKVDGFIPGCPPPTERIKLALQLIIEGKPLVLPEQELKFG